MKALRNFLYLTAPYRICRRNTSSDAVCTFRLRASIHASACESTVIAPALYSTYISSTNFIKEEGGSGSGSPISTNGVAVETDILFFQFQLPAG